MQPGSLRMSAFRGRIDGIPVLLLRPDWGQSNLFKGSRIYGGSYNELEAYLAFSRCDVAVGCRKQKEADRRITLALLMTGSSLA